MGLFDMEWNAVPWGIGALRALPDEQRVRVLERARDEARVAQRVFIGLVIVAVAATVATGLAFEFLHFRPTVPYVVVYVPLLAVLGMRAWRNAIVRRSVHAQLRDIRYRTIATITGSWPTPSTSPTTAHQ